MNDIWLFLGCLVFLFLLWVYAGGPTNPISFSGPYITPVTAPGTTQVGYGPSANTFFKNEVTGGHTGDVIDSARSPYANDVRIGYSDPRAGNSRDEYIVIHLESDNDIDITGWQLVGAQNGTHVVIPEGSRGSSSSKRDMTLSVDYRDAYIISGTRASDSIKSSYSGEWHTLLGNRSDIWDDDSDTITLLDQNGKVVDQYSY